MPLKFWPFRRKLAKQPIPFDALVVPPGGTVVLRTSRRVSQENWLRMRASFERAAKARGIHVFVLDDAWEGVVIGEPP